MKIYIAHRLYALHDRILASRFASSISKSHNDVEIYLPYCDTKQDTLILENKGFYIYEKDIERLNELDLIIAILHGPTYDDGVCFELGYAYAKNKKMILVTTDFLTYTFRNSPIIFNFTEPLLEVVKPTIFRITQPEQLNLNIKKSHYENFANKNEKSLTKLVSQVSKGIKNVSSATNFPILHIEYDIFIESVVNSQDSLIDCIKEIYAKKGYNIYSTTRFTNSDVVNNSIIDIQAFYSSKVILLDVNGVETPNGSAFFEGMGRALNKKIILYYNKYQQTHAFGREPNYRNLMILYGADCIVSNQEELLTAIDRII